MGTRGKSKVKAPSTSSASSSSPTGGFGRMFLCLVAIAGLVAWGVVSLKP